MQIIKKEHQNKKQISDFKYSTSGMKIEDILKELEGLQNVDLLFWDKIRKSTLLNELYWRKK